MGKPRLAQRVRVLATEWAMERSTEELQHVFGIELENLWLDLHPQQLDLEELQRDVVSSEFATFE